MDLNASIAKYIANNKDADKNKILNSIENLKSSAREHYVGTDRASDDCIFNFEGDVSEDEFLEMMSRGTGKNIEDIQDEVSILFDILDSSENKDSKLSKEEMSSLLKDDGSINSFSLFNKLANYKEDLVNDSIVEENAEKEAASYADSFLNGTVSMDSIESKFGVNSSEYQNVLAKIAEGYSDAAKEDVKGLSSLSDLKVDEIISKINNGTRRLSDYQNLVGSSISSSDYEKIKSGLESTQKNITTEKNITEEKTIKETPVMAAASVDNTQVVRSTGTSTIPSDLANSLDAKLGSGFSAKVEKIAKNLNCSPTDLLGVMYSESGLNPQAGNSLGYVGLIQFSPYYYNTSSIKNMSAIQQLDLVEKAIMDTKSWALNDKNAKLDAGTLYSLIFLPAYAKNDVLVSAGDSHGYYNSNKGLDLDHNGNISKADLNRRVAGKYNELLQAYT